MIRFRLLYFLLAVLLFIIEVCIALFMNDRFIRPYGGDYLVVMLIYCAVMSLWRVSYWKAAIVVLCIAFLVEGLQYFNLVEHLGLLHNKLARTVIGVGFEWWDLLAYTLGVITIIVCERADRHKISRK